MLFHLLAPYAHDFILFNLFRYITFRTGCAMATSLVICFVIGPAIIRWLKKKQGEGQPIRSDGPESHLKKKGTPTMGGLMILISAIASTLLWADLSDPYTWTVILVMTGFGLVGFMDDFRKLTRRSHHGVPGKVRLAIQIIISGLAVYSINMTAMALSPATADGLAIPFIKDYMLPLAYSLSPLLFLSLSARATRSI